MERHDPFPQELTAQREWEHKETDKLLPSGGSCVLEMSTSFWRWVGDGARSSPWRVKESYMEEMYFQILIRGKREND